MNGKTKLELDVSYVDAFLVGAAATLGFLIMSGIWRALAGLWGGH